METGSAEMEKLTLVARKPCFELPIACPTCLPVYIYLKLSNTPFTLLSYSIHPDSDQIPFVERGDYVAYNNEKGGVLRAMKEDGVVDLDGEIGGVPEWVSTKAMVESWLVDAVMYELWVGSDGKTAHKIYYSDLPWPIGKVLYFKQVRAVKQLLGITAENADRREEEIYRRAGQAYGALSSLLGEQSFFFQDRPTSVDAVVLAHVLFTLHALPETSVLRGKLLDHTNLVSYAERLKKEYIDAISSSSSVLQSDSSSSSKPGPSRWSSKPKRKPKREKTEEEKKFRRRAKYFLATQVIAVLVFLSLLGGSDDTDLELGDDDYE